ncbi:MAG TPA: PAS domain-containing protein, partial [Actinomycetes bacterium]|nr:PAS domain-containing protein [Actinomycetes bacterium]
MELRANLPPPGPAGLNEASGADLRDVLGELPEGVAVVDASGRLLYANAEAVRIWGFDDPGEVPPSFRDFAPAFEVRDAEGAAVSRSSAGRRPGSWPASAWTASSSSSSAATAASAGSAAPAGRSGWRAAAGTAP